MTDITRRDFVTATAAAAATAAVGITAAHADTGAAATGAAATGGGGGAWVAGPGPATVQITNATGQVAGPFFNSWPTPPGGWNAYVVNVPAAGGTQPNLVVCLVGLAGTFDVQATANNADIPPAPVAIIAPAC